MNYRSEPLSRLDIRRYRTSELLGDEIVRELVAQRVS